MSKQLEWRRIAAAAAGVVAVLGCLSLAFAQEPKGETFAAVGVNMGSIGGGGGTATVQIIIDRWSTEAERQTLIKAFQEKGPEGLLSALQKTERIGTLRTPNRLGWDLHYAVQARTKDGGRRIMVATDRAIAFQEASRSTRTMDYPFTLVELHLDKDNKGEGRMSIATKIVRSKDGKSLELENYGSDPVRLKNVRRQKG